MKHLYIVILLISMISSVDRLNANSLETSTQDKERCEFKYAWTEFPPFMVPNPTKPSGAQIELMEWVAMEMGCELHFINMNWNKSIAGIEEGTVDVMGRASKTTQRSRFAHFSTSYRDELLVLTVRKGEAQSLRYGSLQELFARGFRLGILRGGYFGKDLEPIIKNPKFKSNIIEHTKEGELLTSLKNKRIDGFFEEPFIIDNAVMTQSLYAEFEEYPIEMLVGEVHFMFSKRSVSKGMVEQFNQALERVQNSDRYKTHWYWSTIRK